MVVGVGDVVHVSSPVVVRLRHPRRSGECEAGRTERPGKEAPPEGPSGRRVDALPGCAAGLFTRPYRPGGAEGTRINRSSEINCRADKRR